MLNSNDSDNHGFRLDGIAKDLLRRKLNKTAEVDLLSYYILKRNKKKIKISELRKLLKPTFKNPFVEKAIGIIFGKKTKKEIVKNELPIMWGLLQIKSEKKPENVFNIINELNIPFKWALATANLENYNILRPLLAMVSSTDVFDLFDIFFKRQYLNWHYFNKINTVSDLMCRDFELNFQEISQTDNYYSPRDPPGTFIMAKIISGFSDRKNIDLPFKLIISLIGRIFNEYGEHSIFDGVYLYPDRIGPFKEFHNKRAAIFIDGSPSTTHSLSNVHSSNKILHEWSDDSVICFYAECFKKRFDKKKLRFMRFMDEEIMVRYSDPYFKNSKIDSIDYYKGQVIVNKFNNPLAPFHYLLKAKLRYDVLLIYTDYDYCPESIDLWEKYREQIYAKGNLFLIQMQPFHAPPLKLTDGYFRIYEWGDKTESLILNTLNYRNYLRNQCLKS